VTVPQLLAAVDSIDFEASIGSFKGQASALEKLDSACTRIAVWSKQLEAADTGNAALAFIRAAQGAAHHVVATCALSLYGASAASVRSVVENGLYYTYFRSHPAELATLVRDPNYFVSRAEMVNYHRTHTPSFKQLQETFGFVGNLEQWYSRVSAIVHGQLPGTWVNHASLSAIEFNATTLETVATEFSAGEKLLHHLLLLTAGRDLWDKFTAMAKAKLLAGLSADSKTALKLDKA
jgi:hypothetical protein